jgi:hypothetical protein
MSINNLNMIYWVYKTGNVIEGRVTFVGPYPNYDVARKKARGLTEETGVLHEVEARVAGSGPGPHPARCSARKLRLLLKWCLPARSPLRAERERYARPSCQMLPGWGALGADAQRAVVVCRLVDGAEAAVCAA